MSIEQELSNIQSKRRARNEYNHRCSRKGYGGVELEIVSIYFKLQHRCEFVYFNLIDHIMINQYLFNLMYPKTSKRKQIQRLKYHEIFCGKQCEWTRVVHS